MTITDDIITAAPAHPSPAPDIDPNESASAFDEALANARSLIADEQYEEAQAVLDALEPDTHPEAARYWDTVADLLEAQGDCCEAIDARKSAGAWWRRTAQGGGSADDFFIFCKNRHSVSNALYAHDDYVQAAAVADEGLSALTYLETNEAVVHLFATTFTSRARALMKVGRRAEAAIAADEAIRYHELAQCSECNGELGHAWDIRGDLHAAAGECAKAVDAYRRALDLWAGVEQCAAQCIPVTRLDYATELAHTGEHEAAIAELQSLIELHEGADVSLAIRAIVYEQLAAAYAAVGRTEEAADTAGRVAELRIAAVEEDPSLREGIAIALRNQGASLSELERYDEALAAADRALEYAEAGTAQCIGPLELRRDVLRDQGRKSEAADAARALVDLYRALGETASVRFVDALLDQSAIHDSMGDGTNALKIADEALAIVERLEDAPWRLAPRAHCARAEALLTLDRFQDAIAAYEDDIAICKRHYDSTGDCEGIHDATNVMVRAAYVAGLTDDRARALRLHADRVMYLSRIAEEGCNEARLEHVVAMMRRGELLEEFEEFDAANAAYEAVLERARRLGGRALTSTLEEFVHHYTLRGKWTEAATFFEEASARLLERLERDGGDEDALFKLLAMTSDVLIPFADGGQAEAAAKGLATCITAGAPDGKSQPEAWRRLLSAAQQLTVQQRRRICGLMDDNGAALRLLIKK